jgi:hypothetical protein
MKGEDCRRILRTFRGCAKHQILRHRWASFDCELVAIATVGQAYRFITSLSTVEWMEFQSLHDKAKATAENAVLSVRATNAVRALFVRAKLLRQACRGATVSHRRTRFRPHRVSRRLLHCASSKAIIRRSVSQDPYPVSLNLDDWTVSDQAIIYDHQRKRFGM